MPALLQIVNPKTWMMALAVVSLFAPASEHALRDIALMALWFLAISVVCLMSCAVKRVFVFAERFAAGALNSCQLIQLSHNTPAQLIIWRIRGYWRSTSPAKTHTRFTAQAAALLQIVNPKTWMMALAVVSLFAPASEHALRDIALMALWFLAISVVCLMCWAWLGKAVNKFFRTTVAMVRFQQHPCPAHHLANQGILAKHFPCTGT